VELCAVEVSEKKGPPTVFPPGGLMGGQKPPPVFPGVNPPGGGVGFSGGKGLELSANGVGRCWAQWGFFLPGLVALGALS